MEMYQKTMKKYKILPQTNEFKFVVCVCVCVVVLVGEGDSSMLGHSGSWAFSEYRRLCQF